MILKNYGLLGYIVFIEFKYYVSILYRLNTNRPIYCCRMGIYIYTIHIRVTLGYYVTCFEKGRDYIAILGFDRC